MKEGIRRHTLFVCFALVLVLIVSGCTTVKFANLAGEDNQDVGYVYFYMVDNETWAELLDIRYVEYDGMPIPGSEWFQRHVGIMGATDGYLPSVMVALNPGLHSFIIGSYRTFVQVEENMTTPVSIKMHAYTTGNDILTYVEEPIPYSEKWKPSRADGLAKRESTANPGFFVLNNALRVQEEVIDEATFLSQMETLAAAHSWTNREMKVLIDAVILTTQMQAEQAIAFKDPYCASKYTNTVIFLRAFGESL